MQVYSHAIANALYYCAIEMCICHTTVDSVILVHYISQEHLRVLVMFHLYLLS